jgi:sulfur carrier protein
MIGLECQPLKMMAALCMRIRLNGEPLELPDGETVAGLITRLELTGRRVAVELNLDIVPRSQHADTTLNDGDNVEVVHAIGGG